MMQVRLARRNGQLVGAPALWALKFHRMPLHAGSLRRWFVRGPSNLDHIIYLYEYPTKCPSLLCFSVDCMYVHMYASRSMPMCPVVSHCIPMYPVVRV